MEEVSGLDLNQCISSERICGKRNGTFILKNFEFCVVIQSLDMNDHNLSVKFCLFHNDETDIDFTNFLITALDR